jgi:hypothetical protein
MIPDERCTNPTGKRAITRADGSRQGAADKSDVDLLGFART